MLGKLAFLFLIGMVVLAMVSARPRRGDVAWRDRFRLRLPRRLLGLPPAPRRRDED